MSPPPIRPVFSERQVLAAEDLNLAVTHAADTDARVVRSISTPGVLQGLRILDKEVPRQLLGSAVVTRDVRLEAGIFCDSFGRIVVVPDDIALAEDRIETDVGTPTEDQKRPGVSLPMPVFLSALDKPTASTARPAGPCSGGAAASRVAEGFELRLGRPGDEIGRRPTRAAPSVGRAGDGTARPILLGFVRCTTGKSQRYFVEVSSVHETQRRESAGVRAAALAGRDDRLQLQTDDIGAAGTPAARLDANGDSLFTVGRLDSRGGIDALFSVNINGDAYVKGSLHAKRSEGQVAVESGLIGHGLRVPLPAGVTDEEVDAGSATVHVMLSQWAPEPSGAANLPMSTFGIDSERWVWCRSFDFATPAAWVDGTCAYLIVVSVPPIAVTS